MTLIYNADHFKTLGCSDYTIEKQQSLESILRYHIAITKGVMPKWGEHTYHYWDLNSGPGQYLLDGQLITGSPLIFLNIANGQGIKYKAHCFEADSVTCAELIRQTKGYQNVEIVRGNNGEMLNAYLPNPKAFGLVYADPNNTEVPFAAMSDFNRHSSNVEFLIHASATAFKRTRSVFNRGDLISQLAPLKRYWLIKQLTGKQHWTFLLGTNWNGFKDYKAIDFWRIDSSEGKDILNRANYTKTELNAIYQPTLPELSGIFETSNI